MKNPYMPHKVLMIRDEPNGMFSVLHHDIHNHAVWSLKCTKDIILNDEYFIFQKNTTFDELYYKNMHILFSINFYYDNGTVECETYDVIYEDEYNIVLRIDDAYYYDTYVTEMLKEDVDYIVNNTKNNLNYIDKL